MGLLSKAAAGSSHQSEAPVSRGGLLSIITNKNTTPVSSFEKALMEKLKTKHDKLGIVQGLVIEALKYSAGEFTGRLSSMISSFGSAQGLAPGRCLVIFNSIQDGELIGKHLAKTVPGNTLFCFNSDTPQDALSLLKPYL